MNPLERIILGQHPVIPAKTVCRLAGISSNTLKIRLKRTNKAGEHGKLTSDEENALTDTLEGLGIYPDALNGWIGGEE
jgi:hypothetical protein